jgi:hypothetical protein
VSTVASRISNGALESELIGRRFEAIQQETVRGFRVLGPVENEWGRSESIDPDNVGDIADEGSGHRG